MPDIHESSYNAWMGRKKTVLRRPTLDCGCPNGGEVSFHLWCDRLACQEHADAPHDCGEFKGSKSGIEEESVEPEAVVDPPTPRPLTLSPETYRALYGPPEPTGAPILGVTTPGDPWSDIVDTYQRIRDNQGSRQPFFTTALDGEAEAFAERVSAALDELVEPEPDEPVDVHRYECPHSRCDWVRVALDLDVFDGLLAEHERAEHAVDPRPWWRRMLPGGTR